MRLLPLAALRRDREQLAYIKFHSTYSANVPPPQKIGIFGIKLFFTALKEPLLQETVCMCSTRNN
jgi:hypothetical protein